MPGGKRPRMFRPLDRLAERDKIAEGGLGLCHAPEVEKGAGMFVPGGERVRMFRPLNRLAERDKIAEGGLGFRHMPEVEKGAGMFVPGGQGESIFFPLEFPNIGQQNTERVFCGGQVAVAKHGLRFKKTRDQGFLVVGIGFFPFTLLNQPSKRMQQRRFFGCRLLHHQRAQGVGIGGRLVEQLDNAPQRN